MEVFGAIVLAMIMLSTAVWYVDFNVGNTNGSSTNDIEATYQELRQSADDQVNLLEYMGPLEAGAGHNAAESAITLPLWGHLKELDHYFNTTWQPGTAWELDYRNPLANNPDHWTTLAAPVGGPVADVASAQAWISGKWNWGLTLPQLSVADGITDEDTLTAHIYHSKLDAPRGDWLKSQVTLQEVLPSGVPGGGIHAYPGESIISVTGWGVSLDAYFTKTGESASPQMKFDGPGVRNPPVLLDLHTCARSGGSDLRASDFPGPTRPTLDFDLPDGWAWGTTPIKHAPDTPDVFSVASFGKRADTGHLFAHLVLKPDAVLTAGECNVMEFSVKYEGTPAVPIRLSAVTLHYGSGLLGDVHALIVDTGAPDATLPRIVTVQAPYMMRAGTTATIGVLLVNGGASANVTKVDVTIPGGYDPLMNAGAGVPLFNGPVTGLQPAVGSWRLIDPRRVEWSFPSCAQACLQVASDQAQEFMFTFTVNESAATARTNASDMAWRSNVSYPATGYHSDAFLDPFSPAIERSSANASSLTNLHGYPSTLRDGTPSGNLVAETRSNGTTHAAPTATTFGLGPTGFTSLASFRAALYNSSFNASQHIVKLGGTTTVTLDARSLATVLSQDGVTHFWANFSAYPPPSMGRYPAAFASFDMNTAPPPTISHALAFDPTGGSNPNVYAAVPGTDTLYALANADGQNAWKHAFGDTIAALAAYQHLTTGLVLVAHGGSALGDAFELDALDANDAGQLKWTQSGASMTGLPVALLVDASGDLAYLVTTDAKGGDKLWILTASTGTLQKTVDLGSRGDSLVAGLGAINPPPFIQNGIAIGDVTRGNITVMDSTGKTKSAFTPPTPLLGLLAVAPAGYASDGQILAAWTSGAGLLKKNARSLTDNVWETSGTFVTAAIGHVSTTTGSPDVVTIDANNQVADYTGTTGTQVFTYLVTPTNPPKDVPDACPFGNAVLDHVFCDQTPLLKPPPATIAIGENTLGNWVTAGIVDAKGDWALMLVSSASGYPSQYVYDTPAALMNTLAPVSQGSISAQLAIGTTDGHVLLETASALTSPATERWNVEPQTFSGLVQLAYTTPLNGFIGTTLLLGQIAWQQPVKDAASVSETASLVDWVNVVGANGQFPDDPAYTCSLSTWQREWAPATRASAP
ncbi:MAG: hypothetical protein ACYDCK_07015 [Thermoplasmatota archaeon]